MNEVHEEPTLAAAIAKTLGEVDSAIAKAFFYRLICRIPLADGFDTIAEGWDGLMLRMGLSGDSGADLLEIIEQKKVRAQKTAQAQKLREIEEIFS